MDKRTTIVWMAILVIVAVVLVSVYKSGVFMPQNQGAQMSAEGDIAATSSAVVPASVNWTPLSPNDKGYAGASYPIGTITSGKYAGRTMYADYISGEMDGYFVDAVHMPDGTRVTFEGCENGSTLQDYVQDCSVTFPDLDAPRKLTDKDGVSLYTYYPFSQAPSLIQGGVSDFIKVSADMKGRPVFLTKDRRTYYLDLPDGRYVRYTPDVSAIIGDDAIPRIEWDSNAPSLNEYSSGDMVYGVDDCFDNWSGLDPQSEFKAAGRTQAGGATVYEPDGQTYQASYECLYQKTQKYNEQGERYFPYSFDVFETRHPIFFYVDAHGAIVPFVSREIVPPAEKAKPVIYLYPTKTTEVHVALNPDGGFTKTVPLYGSGWDVIAKPSGALTNVARGAAYPYLFWEGGGAGVTPTPEKGFVVSKSDVPSFLVKTLAEFGLNQKEIGDFTDFWVPKLSTAPYYFITFVDRADIDRTAPLSVTPAPDTVIRVLMDYRPLDKKISVEPLPISKTERQGFTVVEWGGVLRK